MPAVVERGTYCSPIWSVYVRNEGRWVQDGSRGNGIKIAKMIPIELYNHMFNSLRWDWGDSRCLEGRWIPELELP